MEKVYKFEDYFNRPISETIADESNTEEAISDYSKEQQEIIDNNNLEFEFIKKNIPVDAFYLFTEALTNSLNLNTEGMGDDKSSVAYITICALAILFEEPKESYKKLFEELRLRGIYGVLRPLVTAMQALKPTLDELVEVAGEEPKDFEEMFKYTELFNPFMMAVSKVIINNQITPDTLEITDGLSSAIVLAMKDLELDGNAKDVIDSIEVEYPGNDIKKYSQFMDEIEMIQDDKSH